MSDEIRAAKHAATEFRREERDRRRANDETHNKSGPGDAIHRENETPIEFLFINSFSGEYKMTLEDIK